VRSRELASCARGAGARPRGAACRRRQQQGARHIPHPQAALAVNGHQARGAERRAGSASAVRAGCLGRKREARDGAGVPHARRSHIPCCMPSALSAQLTKRNHSPHFMRSHTCASLLSTARLLSQQVGMQRASYAPAQAGGGVLAACEPRPKERAMVASHGESPLGSAPCMPPQGIEGCGAATVPGDGHLRRSCAGG